MTFSINNNIKTFFQKTNDPSDTKEFQRRALTNSAGHACINTRPVIAVDYNFDPTQMEQIDRVRQLFKNLIEGLITKQFVSVVKDLWKLELKYTLDKTNRTSLSLRSFRKWLNSNDPTDNKIALVISGISALNPAISEQNFNELLATHGWNDQEFSEFETLVTDFAKAQAKKCSNYFFHIMDQQQAHSANRFVDFIEVHKRFVNRISDHLPQFAQNRKFRKRAEDAMAIYKSKQIEFFSPPHPDAPPLTVEEKQKRSHLSFYRREPMVKHESQPESVIYAEPYGSGKNICHIAQTSNARKVAVLEFLPNSFEFAANGLRQDLVVLEEAHVIPVSKIFSGFGYHIARFFGFMWENSSKHMESLITEFTHKTVFGHQIDGKIVNLIDRLLKSKDTTEVKYAKMFMFLEFITLLEASKTDHMPSFYNQIIDHLSESLTKNIDKNATTDPLALRIVPGLHALLDLKRPVNGAEVMVKQQEYFDSVKRASRDWLLKKKDNQHSQPSFTIKEALGLIGAFDHLQAVYRAELLNLESIVPLEGFDHDVLFELMERWVHAEAEKNEIKIK